MRSCVLQMGKVNSMNSALTRIRLLKCYVFSTLVSRLVVFEMLVYRQVKNFFLNILNLLFDKIIARSLALTKAVVVVRTYMHHPRIGSTQRDQ